MIYQTLALDVTRGRSATVFFFPCIYKEKVNFLLVCENPEMSYTRRKFANTRRKFDVHGGSLLNNNIYLEKFDRDGENRQP